MKLIIKNFRRLYPLCFFALITVVLFWKYLLKGLAPIPADLIVGIYHPWRDYIWGEYVAGVPFRNGVLSDVVSIIYPWRIYAMETIKASHLPLWIPQALCGHPLLANFQSAVFYPLNLLFLIFKNVNAWSIYVMFQPFLAGLFCFYYLKNLKLKTVACLTGSIIFSLCGFFGVWMEYGIVGHSGLWLPLMLLSVDKIYNLILNRSDAANCRKARRWMLAGGLAVAASLLAGYPQISLMSVMIAGVYALFRGAAYKSLKGLLLITLFLILGILISGVQIVPGAELFMSSIRQRDQTVSSFGHYLNPAQNLLLLIAPDFFGNPSTQNFWGSVPYNEAANYVSVAGVLLSLVAIITRFKDKTVLFAKFLLLTGLVFVFKNPISSYIFGKNLPFFASSSAGRFNYLVDFSLVILAAYGLDVVLNAKVNRRKLAFIGFCSFLIIVFVLFIILNAFGWPQNILLTNYSVVSRNLLLPLGLTVISVAGICGLAWMGKSKIFSGVISVLLLLVMSGDLLRFGLKYNSFSSPGFLYPDTGLTDFLKNKSGVNRFSGLIPQSMFIPYNLSSPEGYDPLIIDRYSKYGVQINEAEFNRMATGSRWINIDRENSPLLDITGTKYVLTWFDDLERKWEPKTNIYPTDRYKLVYQYGKSQVYENVSALPRALVFYNYKVAEESEIIETLMSKKFDYRNTLLLEKRPNFLSKNIKAGGEAIIGADDYYVNPNKIIITAKAKEHGILFLSDNYYPGWKVRVDGIEKEVLRANYTFRGVELSRGEHKVEFYYEPPSFRIGLVMTVIGFIALIAISVL